jgi:hypothetical protein
MKPLVIVAAVVLLAGCSSVHARAASAPTPKATHPTVKVSVATTCDLLFGPTFNGGPMQDAQNIVSRFAANPDGSTVTLDEVDKTLDSLKSAEASASSDLVPFLDAEAAPLSKLHDALSGGPNSSIELTEWKAASIELINRCK